MPEISHRYRNSLIYPTIVYKFKFQSQNLFCNKLFKLIIVLKIDSSWFFTFLPLIDSHNVRNRVTKAFTQINKRFRTIAVTYSLINAFVNIVLC